MNKLNWFNPSENVPDDGARIIVESKAGFGIVTFHSWNFKENKNKIWWIDSPVFRYAYLPKEEDDEFWSYGNDNLENVYSLVVGNNSNSSIVNMNNISLLKPHQKVNEYTINKYHILNY